MCIRDRRHPRDARRAPHRPRRLAAAPAAGARRTAPSGYVRTYVRRHARRDSSGATDAGRPSVGQRVGPRVASPPLDTRALSRIRALHRARVVARQPSASTPRASGGALAGRPRQARGREQQADPSHTHTHHTTPRRLALTVCQLSRCGAGACRPQRAPLLWMAFPAERTSEANDAATTSDLDKVQQVVHAACQSAPS